MTQRTVSIEAVALRAEARARHAEQDALLLQEELLQARKQLTADLEAANIRIAELEASTSGTTS